MVGRRRIFRRREDRIIFPERENPFMVIGADGTLITACMLESFDTMTASWGGLGVLGGRKVPP